MPGNSYGRKCVIKCKISQSSIRWDHDLVSPPTEPAFDWLWEPPQWGHMGQQKRERVGVQLLRLQPHPLQSSLHSLPPPTQHPGVGQPVSQRRAHPGALRHWILLPATSESRPRPWSTPGICSRHLVFYLEDKRNGRVHGNQGFSVPSEALKGL